MQQILPQHHFQIIGLISTLSFIVAWLDYCNPFTLWNDALNLFQEILSFSSKPMPILSYSRTFLNSKYDEIVDFSKIGQFIDVPIRNYSFEMMMRLDFSIETEVKPKILIVEEIITIGDAAFREKAGALMMELISCSTTVLFVSYSLEQIRKLCNRIIWLKSGSLYKVGDTNSDKYKWEN